MRRIFFIGAALKVKAARKIKVKKGKFSHFPIK
jgi:hypothetical protein